MALIYMGPEAQARIDEIVAFASRPENLYRPGKVDWVPGNRPEFVFHSGTIRAVFSFTRHPHGHTIRHLTISTSSSKDYPAPQMVWTIAKMFGFFGAEADKNGIVTQPAKTWAVGMDEFEHCIVVQQKLES
jgi:hypothetical protein